MDNSKNNIGDFELLLQKQSFKKPSFLYNKNLNLSVQTYTPQDVIKTVRSQVKAFQLADCVGSAISRKNMNEAKKSKFLPSNKLPVYGSRMEEVPKVTERFETQCVFDTQLMDIIDGAATIGTNTGMTQEFDTTFAHTDLINIENPKLREDANHFETNNNDGIKNNITSILDENSKNITKRDQGKEEGNTISSHNVTKKRSEIDHIMAIQNLDNLIDVNTEQDSQISKTAIEDTVTFIDNLPITQEVNEELEATIKSSKENNMEETMFSTEITTDTGQDIERPTSPLITAKAIKRKLRTPYPLVVSLETFENFENVAMPLIEETDFEIAKHLIHSQILGKELCLYNEAEILLGIERPSSPVLGFKSDELQINSTELLPAEKVDEVGLLQDIEYITEKSMKSEVLQDEILFSSDEEDLTLKEEDFAHIETQNLPPTCALDVSNDQTDILEKSMFVGFQTASNKSIQIFRGSFEQAQIILNSDGGKAVEEFSLTELVEKCDSLKPKQKTFINTAAKAIEGCETKAVAVSAPSALEHRLNKGQKLIDSNECDEKTETCILYSSRNSDTVGVEKQSCNGFMTASNKKINMSDSALEICQKVFMDIDLNEQFDSIEITGNKNCLNIEENTNDKINDEILLEEFKNIEMSLEEKGGNSSEYVTFQGFKTGNNKKIAISEEAVTKTKNVFQDIGIQSKKPMTDTEIGEVVNTIKDINLPSTSKAVYAGFKTANNKEINISDEALAKSKDVFKDIGKDKNKLKTIEDIISQPLTSNAIFVGFKTANNKDIKISDKALSKTKYIFKNIDKEQTKLDTPNDANRLSASQAVFEGFNTASSKHIEVSDMAPSKSKNMAKEMFAIEEAKPVFKTLSDKQVKISDQATEKIRKPFTDVNDNDSTKMISEETVDSHKNTKVAYVSFTIANNKAVNVSAEAIEKSKNIFSDLHPIDSNYKTQYCTANNKEDNLLFKGFQTASKKPVTVSMDALAKSKKIFRDIDVPNDSTTEKISMNTNVEFMSFQTANKKTVVVNKEALIESKKLLNNLSDSAENSRNAYVGFKTASNKNVNISDEALAKSKKIFDDIEDIPITAQDKLESKENIFKGFQTANKNKIEISKEALEKTNNLFNNINDFAKKETGKSFVGFLTGRKNKVFISEQALAKSRQLLHDIDTESDVDIRKTDTIVPFYNDITGKNGLNDSIGFKIDTNKEITNCDNASTKPNKLFCEHVKKRNNHIVVETKKVSSNDLEIKKDLVNIDKMLDTQVINDFEEDVCNEDFKETSRPNKRSGSPILVCPKAKKIKKFETPYIINPKTVTVLHKDVEVTKPANIIFREDYKKNKKYTLKDLTNLEKGQSQSIDSYILNFNLENILNFEFHEGRNDFVKGKMAIEDIKQIFIEATDKKLIPDGWLDIHLKLILWKLISYEIRFPTLGKVCTVKNVLDQLKYRYDKELYNAERSVLRKILEKDDVPNKTMVLCVAGIYVDGVSVVSAANLNNIELLLTDGWYFIKATIDNMLSKLVYDRKIVVGCKILTCGAELVNCEQGVAPWEDTSSIRLSLSGNSTRPASWTEKLGLRPCTMVARLAVVRVGGGKVARLRARVVRVYPRLYVEKFPDGSTVTRSERLEHQYQMKYEAEREALIEKIYEEVEKKMSDQESQDSDVTSDPSNKRKCLDSGSQIAKLMKTSRDPMEFRAQLSSSQIHLLQEHVSKQRDKYLQAIQDRVQEKLQTRNVITLARGRIAGLERDGNRVTVTKGMLSIWKPNDEVLDIFEEGSWIEVTNVVPTAFRNSEIQLSAGRQSVFRPVKCKEDIFKPYLKSLSRTCYNLKDLSQNPSMITDHNEIDTVGMIFSIDPSNREFDSNKNQFQNVYLADIDKNIICVNFWGGIKKFGYENILDTGQVIYCGNLQKRAGNTRKNIPQFRATEFAIFTKTPKNEKGREMLDELNKKMYGLDRRKFCEDCVAVKQNFSVIKSFNVSENVSPYIFNNSNYNLGRNKEFIDTPVGVKVKNKKEDFNLTGLDFESTFKQQDTQLSPKTLERRKKVNEKIAKLKMYGEPPPLSPINIMNKSKNATNSYKSPLLRNKEMSSNASVANVNKLQGVATPTKLPDDSLNDSEQNSVTSPIISKISMNRTYVKRSINPVKLRFSENVINENVDRTVDHFAEEFDGSPPLSLE